MAVGADALDGLEGIQADSLLGRAVDRLGLGMRVALEPAPVDARARDRRFGTPPGEVLTEATSPAEGPAGATVGRVQ